MNVIQQKICIAITVYANVISQLNIGILTFKHAVRQFMRNNEISLSIDGNF